MSVPAERVPEGLFDPGLQPERTTLSWRRTALSIAVGSLIAMRLLPVWLGGAIWVMPGVVGLLGAGAVWAISRRRHRLFTAQLRDGAEPRTAGAAPLAALALGTVTAGVLGLILVVAAA